MRTAGQRWRLRLELSLGVLALLVGLASMAAMHLPDRKSDGPAQAAGMTAMADDLHEHDVGPVPVCAPEPVDCAALQLQAVRGDRPGPQVLVAALLLAVVLLPLLRLRPVASRRSAAGAAAPPDLIALGISRI